MSNYKPGRKPPTELEAEGKLNLGFREFRFGLPQTPTRRRAPSGTVTFTSFNPHSKPQHIGGETEAQEA